MRTTLIPLIGVVTVFVQNVVFNDEVAAQAPMSVKTRDGLKLSFDAEGNVTVLQVGRKSSPPRLNLRPGTYEWRLDKCSRNEARRFFLSFCC